MVRRSYEERLKQPGMEPSILELFTTLNHLFEQSLLEVKTDRWMSLLKGRNDKIHILKKRTAGAFVWRKELT